MAAFPLQGEAELGNKIQEAPKASSNEYKITLLPFT